MKRVRNIDLESPVTDEDEEDELRVTIDGKLPAKKSRWTVEPNVGYIKENSLRRAEPVSSVISFDLNGRCSEGEQTSNVGTELISEDRQECEEDLQMATPRTTTDFTGAYEVVTGGRTQVSVGLEGIVEKQVQDYSVKISKCTGSAAHVLYTPIDQHEDGLYLFLQEQRPLVQHAEAGVRLEATRLINNRLGSVRETVSREFVISLFLQQLWQETDNSVSIGLVRVLTTAARLYCADEKLQGAKVEGQMSTSYLVAARLLDYLKANDVQSKPMMSDLKMQILRAFDLLAEAEGREELSSFQDVAADQLEDRNPKIRKWGIRSLVATVIDRVYFSLPRKEILKSASCSEGMFRGQSLMHSLLEFTGDPHPGVREEVMSALLALHRKGYHYDSATYKHAVALLKDSFEGVRILAIRLIGSYSKDMCDGGQAKIVDNAFCSMITDMSVVVRQEVCSVLGEMSSVCDSFLLQSLSKKLFDSAGEREIAVLSEGQVEDDKLLLKWSAGAFVVALEDEFWEVRLNAVRSLSKLGVASERMGRGALELVIDMINDDSSIVRREAITSLTSLACAGRLVVQETYLHMMLGIMEDSEYEIREGGHSLLSSITLPSVSTFQETLRAILGSVHNHPEDSKIAFTTLQKLGRSHSKYIECIISELLLELRRLLNSDAGLDDPQCIGIFVLLLASAVSNEKIVSMIPLDILVLTRHVRDKVGTLPSLLVQPVGFKSMRFSWCSSVESPFETFVSTEGGMEGATLQSNNSADVKFQECNGIKGRCESKACHLEGHGVENMPAAAIGTRFTDAQRDAVDCSLRHIASVVSGSSSLLEINAFKDVQQNFRKGLNALREICGSQQGAVAFYSLYIKCLEILFQLRRRLTVHASIMPAAPQRRDLLHELVAKLELCVNHLLYRFLGLSYHHVVFIYELYALLWLWKFVLHPAEALEDVRPSVSAEELELIVGASKGLSEDETSTPSLLLWMIQEQVLKKGSWKGLSTWMAAREIARSYWPREMSIILSIIEVRADIQVSGSGPENILEFIPGFPWDCM